MIGTILLALLVVLAFAVLIWAFRTYSHVPIPWVDWITFVFILIAVLVVLGMLGVVNVGSIR